MPRSLEEVSMPRRGSRSVPRGKGLFYLGQVLAESVDFGICIPSNL